MALKRLPAILAPYLAVALVACGGGGSTSTNTTGGPLSDAQLKGRNLVIEGWGGAWTAATQKYFGDPFAQKYGVNVTYPSAPNPGTAVHLQAQSGTSGIDLCDTCSYSNYKQGDLQNLPSWLSKTAKDSVNTPDTCVGTAYLSCYGDTATLIACNPDIIQKCPTNAKEFWDVKNFPGPRAISGTQPPDAQLLFAEMAMGTPKDKLYPIDIPKAINKLKEIKPYINAWPASGGQMQQVLIDKEVGLCYCWNGRMFTVQRDNIHNLKLYWDDSTVGGGGGMSVPKGAANADVAFTFLNWWVQQPDLQAQWTTSLTYPTPNKKVDSLLAANIKAGVPYSPTHSQPVHTDLEFSYAHQMEEQQAWQQFLTGQG